MTQPSQCDLGIVFESEAADGFWVAAFRAGAAVEPDDFVVAFFSVLGSFAIVMLVKKKGLSERQIGRAHV